jgi:hypothetical protein
MRGLTFYWYIWKALTWTHYSTRRGGGSLKLVTPCQCLMRFLYLAGYQFWLFLQYWYLILELSDSLVFSFLISRSFPHSRLITRFVTRLAWRVPLVEQELLTLPEHLSSPPVFSGVRVTRSLVLYVCFVDRCLSLCTFSVGHCVVCSSSICGFWLPLWYLQTLLIDIGLLLTRKLLKEMFLVVKSKSSLRTFYGRHHDLWSVIE